MSPDDNDNDTDDHPGLGGVAIAIPVPVTLADRASCSASELLARVGDKWSVLVLSLLSQRGYGFNELDRAVSGLSRRMLTRTLHGLVRDGLVSRTAQPRPAARVEYALTELGRSLLPLVVALGEWAETHQPDIGRARTRYDARLRT